MVRVNDLIDQVLTYAPDADSGVVLNAYCFAAKAHEKQKRKSGLDYVTHPLEVGVILASLRMDVDTIATGLLHDTVEDTLTTPEELRALFGPEVEQMVLGVTKLGRLEYRSKQEAAAENFRKMLLAMSRDVRVILVKLADRLHNMRTLGSMEESKARRIAQETMDIYAPIAGRLGLNEVKVELEDLCLGVLNPDRFAEITEFLTRTEPEREAWRERMEQRLRELLDREGIPAVVSGRVKHRASIHRKMVANDLAVDQVMDLLAFRVLVDDIGGCYSVLGHVHMAYPPLPGRFKDYIAMPKSNQYQSLHTTVIGPDRKRLEVQIRTHEMHRVAETGIAAHWKYKRGHLDASQEQLAQVARVRELLEAVREVEDPIEFMEALKVDLYDNEVFVVTPAGDVLALCRGATALDFAYAVHSEVGHHCVRAKVDGRIVQLRHELQNGDVVEIETSKEQHPRRDWLQWARTGRALSKIRRHLREEEREMGERLGRDLLQGELRKRGTSLEQVHRDGRLREVLKGRGVRDLGALLVGIAQGSENLAALVRELLPGDPAEEERVAERRITGFFDRLRKRAPVSPVVINGEDNIHVTMAGCCRPLPGEDVSGFLTHGRGISVHRSDCDQLGALDHQRVIPVSWGDRPAGTQHSASIRVVCADRPGLLASITRSCEDAGINISRADVRQLDDGRAEAWLQFGVADYDELQRLIRRIERIRGVISVDRAGPMAA